MLRKENILHDSVVVTNQNPEWVKKTLRDGGKEKPSQRRRWFPHTLFHTVECIQIMVNHKCRRRIPDSGERQHVTRAPLLLRSNHWSGSRSTVKFLSSIPQAYHELATSQRFVCRHWATSRWGIVKLLLPFAKATLLQLFGNSSSFCSQPCCRPVTLKSLDFEWIATNYKYNRETEFNKGWLKPSSFNRGPWWFKTKLKQLIQPVFAFLSQTLTIWDFHLFRNLKKQKMKQHMKQKKMEFAERNWDEYTEPANKIFFFLLSKQYGANDSLFIKRWKKKSTKIAKRGWL